MTQFLISIGLLLFVSVSVVGGERAKAKCSTGSLCWESNCEGCPNHYCESSRFTRSCRPRKGVGARCNGDDNECNRGLCTDNKCQPKETGTDTTSPPGTTQALKTDTTYSTATTQDIRRVTTTPNCTTGSPCWVTTCKACPNHYCDTSGSGFFSRHCRPRKDVGAWCNGDDQCDFRMCVDNICHSFSYKRERDGDCVFGCNCKSGTCRGGKCD